VLGHVTVWEGNYLHVTVGIGTTNGKGVFGDNCAGNRNFRRDGFLNTCDGLSSLGIGVSDEVLVESLLELRIIVTIWER